MAIASPPVPASPTEQLRGAVDAVVAVDPDELSDAALASWLLATRAEMDRQDAAFARAARAAHTRGVGALDGAASTAAWLRTQARMREGDARAAIEAGGVSELLAETGEAWRAGEVSSAAFRTIAAARVDGFDDVFVGCEGKFLDLARRHDLRSLRLATAHFKRLALADGTEPSAHDGLHVSRLYDGVTVIKGELSDVAAETVVTALHAYTDPPDDQFPKTTSRRYAEALVRICEVALAHTGTPDTGPGPGVDRRRLEDPDRTATRTAGRRVHRPHPSPRRRAAALRLRRSAGSSPAPTHSPSTWAACAATPLRRCAERSSNATAAAAGPAATGPPGSATPTTSRTGNKAAKRSSTNLVLLCSHHHHVTHQPGWSMTFDGTTLKVDQPAGTGFL